MFDKVLIANRGAIAVRIERTLKKMGVKSVAVYSKADRDSLHVENADEAFYLGEGTAKETYLDIDKIIKAAVSTGAQAIHPGYGFLSENTEFALKCTENGIKFIGPSVEQINKFGLKHSARALAEKVNVPLLPGTGLLSSIKEAAEAAKEIGYPVMLKSTAGGGGIGIRICYCEEELLNEYEKVCYLAEKNFNDGGVFVEKYVEKARHIEVQIFGNEYGEVVAIGERDCSVQRRNQKVVEESPAPNISDETRERMYQAACALAGAVSYKSAGTVEYLYDDSTKEFYFLEVNTRLQVEHGITEEVYGVDLVEWMVLEAAGELKNLNALLKEKQGHSIEIRVYAEDCFNNFRPSSGKIDKVIFDENARVETWIRDNIEVTALYDPMLAKIIVHDKDRDSAIQKMIKVIANTKIYGVTTNLEYLKNLLEAKDYSDGVLFTKMLEDFTPYEHTIEVLDGGIQSTIQDYPGIVGYWTVGVPPCGPMDNFHFRLGNKLLGNDDDAAGIEMTLNGGTFRFRIRTSFCITGADMNATLDGEAIEMNRVVYAEPLQVLKFETCEKGMRTYLTVSGGFDVPKILNSRSTFVDGKFGGHNGRSLRAGDVLHLFDNCFKSECSSFPENYLPSIENEWEIGVLPGPQPTSEYLKEGYLETLVNTEYTVNFNSARTGVRLNGPIPQWARVDGGEAGLHPSNIHDNAYAVGTLDLTGDQSILLGPDGPSLGGFVCPVTTASGELWKLGQLHPGDKVRFKLLSLEQAKAIQTYVNNNLNFIYTKKVIMEQLPIDATYAILCEGIANDTRYCIRLDGEENILIEIGEMELNIENRFRVHILMNKLSKMNLPIIDMTPGIRSLQIHFDISKSDAKKMAKIVEDANKNLGNLENITVPSRILHLPLSWDDPQTREAALRYQKTVRPDAPWCPSNPEFIRRINGLDTVEEVMDIVFQASYLVLGLGDVYLGAPVATPIDPRHRMVTTKYNPARPWTPENAVGIGGAYLCVYGMEGPGGYQFVGRTIQMWNLLKETKLFTAQKPWLLNFFDQIKFYPCSAEEILQYRDDFIRGKFDIEIEETSFSLGEYKKYLEEIKDSAAKFKAHQEASFQAERTRWKEQGLDHFVSEEVETSSLMEIKLEPGDKVVNATIPGSVWKVLVEEGQTFEKGDILVVLESMKMEFQIKAAEGGTVKKVFLNPSDHIEAGQIIISYK